MAETTPWIQHGVTLGFIRGGVFYIDRTVRGRRFKLSTGCRTAAAAFAEYTAFEKDPFHYSPRATSGTSWADAVLEFLKYQQFTQGRTPKYVEEQARYLERFGQRKEFWGLDSFTRDDIEAFLADLQRQAAALTVVSGAPASRSADARFPQLRCGGILPQRSRKDRDGDLYHRVEHADCVTDRRPACYPGSASAPPARRWSGKRVRSRRTWQRARG